ncbi:MAG: hypothetical protein JNM17_34500 [Archangium sp.]|nr:hypothetical protein [Archangium sp.]
MKALLKVLLGLALGLVIAEFAFRMRDEGAFPHLNFYKPDDALGVRLEPNATMKLRVANNAVTTVTTNSKGYRGAEWPAPSGNDVLVLGDSQTFGLGVNDDETFAAVLGKELGAPALNLGVPTWGPLEYTAALEEQLRDRKPKSVVFVLNLANDLFEGDRPNTKRHKVWDGWAVRAETAPTSVTNFPMRRWFMSQSHLVFGVRKLMYTKDNVDEGFASEGTFKDVVAASPSMHAEAADEPTRKFYEARKELDSQLAALTNRLEDHLGKRIIDDEEWQTEIVSKAEAQGERTDDIFEEEGEGGRSVNTTALQLLAASLDVPKNEAWLKQLANDKGDDKLKSLIEQRKKLRQKLLATKLEANAVHEVPLDRLLAKVKRSCDAAGARLIVVLLPLDVMTSADEWKKYDAKPVDLTPTIELRAGAANRIRALGAEAFDPTEVLSKAAPGAFLDKDLHLSVKGHATVGKALAEVLKGPPPPPVAQLPPGRSWPPDEDESVVAPEVTLKGSSAAKCSTRMARDWLIVQCKTDDDSPGLTGMHLTSGGHGDAFYVAETSTLTLPLLEGDSVRATFYWDKESRELQLDWPKGAPKPTMLFTEPQKIVGEKLATNAQEARGSGMCDPGFLVSGATKRCAKACSADNKCAEGSHCEPWPSGEFCATP